MRSRAACGGWWQAWARAMGGGTGGINVVSADPADALVMEDERPTPSRQRHHPVDARGRGMMPAAPLSLEARRHSYQRTDLPCCHFCAIRLRTPHEPASPNHAFQYA